MAIYENNQSIFPWLEEISQNKDLPDAESFSYSEDSVSWELDPEASQRLVYPKGERIIFNICLESKKKWYE